MNRFGEVIEADSDFAKVKLNRHSACTGCNGCNKGEEEEQKNIEIRVLNTENAHIGDIVEINMESQNILKAAVIAYGLPFITLLLGIIIGYKVFNNEIISILLGFGFLGITYFGIQRNENKFYNSHDYVPELVRVVKHEERKVTFKL